MTFAGLAQGVAINLFLLLGFVALFSMLRYWPAARLHAAPAWVNGLLFGLMAVVAMYVPLTLGPGVIFDCRAGVVGAAALLGGPLCALGSVILPILYRLQISGTGVVPGLLEIILPAVLGSLCYWHAHRRGHGLTIRCAVVCSLIVGIGTNILVVGTILAFMPRRELMLDVGSGVLVTLNAPVSMALFSALLLLAQQRVETLALHSSVLETAIDGFWLLDREGRLLEVNDSYRQMSGYSEAELLTRRVADLEASETAGQVATRLQALAATGDERFESCHRRQDGSLYDVEVSVRYLAGDRGRFVVFLRDITERKKVERALRESERKYKLLIETTNTGFVIVDAKGCVLDANQEYIRLTGRTSLEDIRGRPVTDWTAPRDRERYDLEVQKCLQAGAVRNLEIDYVNREGRVTPIEIHAAVLPGEPQPQIMTVCRDISERRQAAEEKARLSAQLTQAQKMEAVGRLAGGVAHDFNNMLGAIMGWADMAREDMTPGSPLDTTVGHITDVAQRATNLTHQLLAFARKQAAAPKVIDLNETIECMLKMLRRLIGENIQLLWKPGASIERVFIDPVQVDQILANLVVNARDAIGHHVGQVDIQTRMVVMGDTPDRARLGVAPGRYVVLAIADNGCGMSRDVLASIFEPFFTTKELGKGTGLGLATVYGIVRQNQGAIEVHSEPGKGTTFEVYLPARAEDAEETRQAASTAMPRGTETILLVEDETTLLEAMQTMLTQLGYTVLPAATPLEALRLACEYAGQVHLLVTDVIMPEMNGRQLAAQLLASRPGLKCLYVSGHTAEVVARHGMLDGDVNFLQKPLLMRALAAKVRAVLATPGPEA